ncbi:MAG: sensor domain-containing diguanylate cyclase [Oscillospiraceae bacterium]|nr:sensor domain-containing diguanylate cyclase [Oscillospiraceae bacterium]
MDLQAFADGFDMMTCIMSVRKFPDGSYGDIRIVTGNAAYIRSYEHTPDDMPDLPSRKFVPNQPYTDYIEKDLNFEDYCYRAAVLKQPLHGYVHPERFDVWFNMFFLPVQCEDPDDPDVAYCTYSMEIKPAADTNLMSNLSPEITQNVLRTCIKLRGAANFQQAMDDVIRDIRELCGAAHCCILLTDIPKRQCSVLSESFLEDSGMQSMNHFLDEYFFDIASSWMNTIAGSSCLIVQNEADFEVLKDRNPRWYASLRGANVDSVVLFPLKCGHEVLGYIWALNFDTTQTVQIKETLELTTFFIGSEIANHQLLARLRTLSSIDMLTGVFSRNEMNNRVDLLAASMDTSVHSLAAIFADLNGLKRTNDTEGHFAGDLMLKNAAITLQRIFYGCEIYRAGGDEFFVLAVNMPESEIASRVQQLRSYSSTAGNVSLAVGWSMAEDSSKIREILRSADEKMYADKEAFYARFPELKR